MADWQRHKHTREQCESNCNGCGRRKACAGDGPACAKTCGKVSQSPYNGLCNCYWAPIRSVTQDLDDVIDMIRSVLVPLGLDVHASADRGKIEVTGPGVDIVHDCPPHEIAMAGARTYTAVTICRAVLTDRTVIERLIRERTGP